MADYSKRTVTTTRIEYVLPSPTNWAEVQKAMRAAQVDLGEDRAQWDNAVTVECRDDELVLWYEAPASEERTCPQSGRLVDLRADGLLWLINRTVFHPRGYSLGYDTATGQFVLLGDGTEPWTFGGDGSDEAAFLVRVRQVMP